MNNWEKDVWKTIQYKLKQDKEHEQTYLETIRTKPNKQRSSKHLVR